MLQRSKPKKEEPKDTGTVLLSDSNKENDGETAKQGGCPC
jgi:hypothetical protein